MCMLPGAIFNLLVAALSALVLNVHHVSTYCSLTVTLDKSITLSAVQLR